MEAVFLKILNMSITASWLVPAVVLLRFLLKKAPKAFSVILWGLVGIRLILPFSLESVLSLVPSTETVPNDIVYSSLPEINSGIAALNSAVNPLISETLAPNGISGANPMQIITLIASTVWIAGIAAMLLYTVISCLIFKRKVREAAPLRDNIFLCDGIATPFILGVIRPRIYLPSNISEIDMLHVIAHERAHLKRHDHLWKPLGFLLLTVYWFNPVLWVAYILLCRDIELACDERVIKDKGSEIKKSYSEALVNCSVPRKMIAACPLAFGEGSVKGRIKSVLNYKKPAFWIIIVSIIACIAVAVCFLTNPITAKPKLPENFTLIDVVYNEHISISVKEVVLDTDNPYIKIEWKNNTPAMLVYGEPFDIEYQDYENGTVSSCMKEDIGFNLPAYYVKPGETSEKTYSLWGFDLSKDGVYVLSTNANYQYDNVKESSNFVVVFGIGDISEYEARLEEISNSEESIIYLPADTENRKEISIISTKTDIDHNGVKETLELETVYQKGIDQSEYPEVFVLNFKEGNEVIYSEEAGASHAGWNALFLYHKDGQDYLLRYNPGMGTGSAGYSYQLFYIGENGSEVIVKENIVRFDINFGSSVHQSFEPKDIDAFLTEINALLPDSIELINTDDDLIESFKREGHQYHIPQFLFGDRDFNYDYDKSMLENLEEYKLTMEAYYAEFDN
ncbi:MAG: hypothetical protein J1E05_01030 [Eubacterium sp.]|nr:hypothetical protein [Eubacterium sp.]